jgi:GMP synthase-like glutamine amidotransferase
MRYLVFQHLAVEHPGSFRDLWRDAGIAWDVVDFGAGDRVPDLDPYDALVVMGGPMDVWQEEANPWLAPEKAAIRRWVQELRRPYLGFCLGHQLLGTALGGTVGLAATSEVGPGTIRLTEAGRADPLLAGLPAEVPVFQWHSAEVSAPPQGATVLATGDACAVQAMRVGPHAWGLQFHIELTAATVPEWAGIPEYDRSLTEIFGPGAMGRMEADVARRLPGYEATAAQLHLNFARAVEGRLAVA